MIEFLLELLKEERNRWRKESEENATLIRELSTKFEKLETDLFLERHMRRRIGRIECDGEDMIDGDTSCTHGYKLDTLQAPNHSC